MQPSPAIVDGTPYLQFGAIGLLGLAMVLAFGVAVWLGPKLIASLAKGHEHLTREMKMLNFTLSTIERAITRLDARIERLENERHEPYAQGKDKVA